MIIVIMLTIMIIIMIIIAMNAGRAGPAKRPSFRTSTLENLSVDSVKNGFLSNPDPGESLLSGNLVMETGCNGQFACRGCEFRRLRLERTSAFYSTQ